ncbi:NAD(P)-binding domain-containing protein [Pedobacter arcticus]|uniref:NAD(P)-binding domain-containing protein n=1 Tax=Pedobacter arcticus TaxID=752140 RepID=UPI00035C23E9|nr:NAD(P)-binding domain-containing protein [Pedobacter arcticus]
MQNKSLNKIAIIGCGWLGFPLAKHLQKAGYLINGSTTSEDKLEVLERSNIKPFLIQLDHENTNLNIQNFLDADLLIINIPPGRATNSADLYVDKMRYLQQEILKSRVKKIVFISSTSVYAENNATHTEDSEALSLETTGLRMLAAEEAFLFLPNTETTVIRMAGLIGPERHPGRFFAGKTDIPNGLAPVNLIHLDDCVGVIAKVIEDGLWSEIFNGVAPTHPSRMEFYDLASYNLYGKNADFIPEKHSFKVIDATKIILKGYQFKHPDLMAWLKVAHQN